MNIDPEDRCLRIMMHVRHVWAEQENAMNQLHRIPIFACKLCKSSSLVVCDIHLEGGHAGQKSSAVTGRANR